MVNEVIAYIEMCQRENASLQRGMNYRIGREHSVILMSVQSNAPYEDKITDEGATLIYEGHDVPRNRTSVDPKKVDQREFTPNGKLTQNGKFHKAAQAYKRGERAAEVVRVYEKIKKGIWSYNGMFHLVDSWQESDRHRQVFKFKLTVIDEVGSYASGDVVEPSRVIPTSVKLAVWQRDNGQCRMCGATNELHFDHVIPFSRGGTSMKAENIQLLCARHNLEKSNRIV